MTVRGVDVGAGVPLQPVVQRDQVQHVQVLPLVLVQPLHLDVEQRLRIDGDAGAFLDEAGQSARLLSAFTVAPLALEAGVVASGSSALELVLEIARSTDRRCDW